MRPRARRRTDGSAAHIPEDVTFQTKPQIAAELVRERRGARAGRAGLGRRRLGVRPERGTSSTSWNSWNSSTCSRCRRRGCSGRPTQRPASRSTRGRVASRVPPARDAARTVVEIANELPASAWKALQVREGAVGPLVFEFAAIRVWGIRHRKPGPPSWLLIRRSLGAEPELKYYVSNADDKTPLSTLALVACTRCRVEEFFEDGKSYLGMAQYETRSWGWY